MERIKRMLSLMMAVLMVVTMLPVPAHAEETEESTEITETVQMEESTEEVLPEESTEEAVQEEPFADVPDAQVPAEEAPEEPAEETEAVQAVPEKTPGMQVFHLEQELLTGTASDFDPDEALMGYLNRGIARPGSIPPQSTSLLAGEQLSGINKDMYKAGKAMATLVARGTESSTWFSISAEGMGYSAKGWSAAELGLDSLLIQIEGINYISNEAIAAVMEKLDFRNRAVALAVVADCPFDMYWRDLRWSYYPSFSDWGISYDANGALLLHPMGELTMGFTVAQEYQGGDAFTADQEKTSAAYTTIQNINAIIDAYAGKSNYEKLVGFRDEICERNTYNDFAADDENDVPYGNPWQLIYVFDNDPTTNVVCEGYSKAFQYLCDNSNLTGGAQVYSVSGVLAGGTGSGNHMWNIAHMEDGKNYLVDITNVDDGTIGYPDKLFLKAPARGDVATSYYFSCGVYYFYSEDTCNTWTQEQLTLASTSYTVPASDGDLGSGKCGDSLSWILTRGGELIIAGSGPMYDYTRANPAPWDSFALKIRSVAFPDGLTAIGSYAFRNCSGFSKLTVPASVASIGAAAFQGAVGITGIEFAGNAPAIGTEAFYGIRADVVVNCTAAGWDSAMDDYGGMLTWYTAHPGASLRTLPAAEPTCTEAGLTEGRFCDACGNAVVPQESIPALGHTEVKIDGTAPTCTEFGLTEGKYCSVCSAVLAEQTVIPAAGHTEVTLDAVSPTCTETGLTEGKYCSVCHTTLTAQTVVPALGHTPVTIQAAEPTCTEAGLTEGTRCSVCHEILTAQEIIPALGHTKVTLEAKAPACTETGLTEGVQCAVCHEILTAQEILPALGHTETAIAGTDPTCTESGLTEGKYCSVCSTVLVEQEVIPAAGHTEGIIDGISPTCTETGLTDGKYCLVCGETLTEQEVIPAAGHTHVTVDPVEPTCTDTGLTEGEKCGVCGIVFTEQEPIPALGHNYVNRICTRCGLSNAACGENLTWDVADGILTITGSGDMYDYEIGTAPWAEEIFSQIVFLEGMTSVGANAFHVCPPAPPVERDFGIEALNDGTGYSFTAVTFPASVVKIGSYAFAACDTLTELSFLGDAPAIAGNAFPAQAITLRHSCAAQGWEAAMEQLGSRFTEVLTHVMETEFRYEGSVHFLRCTNPDCDYREATAEHTYDTEWHSDVSGHWHTCTECGALGTLAEHIPDRDAPTLEAGVHCTQCGYALADPLAYIEISAPQTAILAGSRMTLRASVVGAAASVRWSLAPGAEGIASIDAAGVLTAAAVSESHTVTVIASAGEGIREASVEITVYPKLSGLQITRGDETVSAVTVDVNSTESVTFHIARIPADAQGEVTWTTSDTAGAYGTFTADGDSCTVSGLHLNAGKQVSFTLTARAADGSGKTAKVTVTLVGLPEGITVDVPEGGIVLKGGLSMSLKAAVSGSSITDKAIVWSIDPIYAPYASVSASGKLTTKPVYRPVDIEVRAAAKQNPDCGVTIPVRLVSAAAAVAIVSPVAAKNGVIHVSSDTMQLQLSAVSFPSEIQQGGTWKVSDKKTAAVANGLVTFLKPGKVTVTFTAGDGSKKSDSVVLQCGNPVTEITISGADSLVSGQKATLTAAVNTDATNRTVTWQTDSPALKITAKGAVTAQTVYIPTEVIVRATAADGSGVYAEKTVTVNPKSNVLGILYQGAAVNGTTISADKVPGTVLPITASEPASWKGGKDGVAIVTGDGILVQGPGTVSFTATSLDGRRTGKVTVKVGTLVSGIRLSAPSEELTSGKGKVTLTAEVFPAGASKVLTWTSSDPTAAAVSSNGVVTAKAGIYKDTQVTVTAAAKDGSGVQAELTLTVHPAATGVEILAAAPAAAVDMTFGAGAALTGRTLKVDVEDCTSLLLAGKVYPFDSADFAGSHVTAQADSGIKWSVSSTKLAEITVNEDGTVRLTPKGTGSVTVTAAATDGSGKKATLKLTLVRNAKTIQVENEGSLTVVSGGKLTLKCTPLPGVPGAALTGKTLQYSIRSEDAPYASISSKGVITAAKKLTSAHAVEVTVTLKENPNVRKTVTVTVLP